MNFEYLKQMTREELCALLRKRQLACKTVLQHVEMACYDAEYNAIKLQLDKLRGKA